MGNKLSSFLVLVGSVIMLLGLCFLASAFGNRDQSVRGAGMLALTFGAMWVAGGLYVKARTLQNAVNAGVTPSQPQATRGGCDLCGTGSPVIHCRVHQLHICSECVARHYDFRSCVYVPSTRRPSSSKPSARSARAGR